MTGPIFTLCPNSQENQRLGNLAEWSVFQRGASHERSGWAPVSCHLLEETPLKCSRNQSKRGSCRVPQKQLVLKLPLISASQLQSNCPEERTTNKLLSCSSREALSPVVRAERGEVERWEADLQLRSAKRASLYHRHLIHLLFRKNKNNSFWSQQCPKFKPRGKCGFWDKAGDWSANRQIN